MRTAKFDVPAEVLTGFLDAACEKGLESTVVSSSDEEYSIEIDYEPSESDQVDKLEHELEILIEEMQE